MIVTISFDPILLRIGAFDLAWHGILTVVAVVVAVWIGLRGAERLGVPFEAIDAPLTWALVGGVAGARAFHVADHLDYYAARPLEVLAIWNGGIAVFGAFLGGLTGGLLAVRGRGLPVAMLLDVAAPSMLVGQAIGRIGCLINGDAWGAPTGADWGLVYTHPNDLLPASLLGVPTHPYPLYEIATVLLLISALEIARRRRVFGRAGDLFLVAAIGYAAIRFGLSIFRQEAVVLWGLQEAQVVALGTAFAAVTALVGVRIRGAGVSVTAAPRADAGDGTSATG